jgi:repressor LexA
MVRTSKGMTERHQKILDYIDERMASGYPPSIREIGEATNISSTSVVTYYLKQLEEWGRIHRDAKYSRALRLSGPTNPGFLKIPILSTIAAGEPIMVPAPGATYIGDEVYGVDVARSLLPAGEKATDLFALILERTEQARNGEMVAIWLPAREETTLKYFYKEKDGYRLQPANPTMKPLKYDKTEPLEIKGKVVLVIRNLATAA